MYNVFVRDFRKQRKRILLTLIALAWGTISIMLLLGFGEGIYEQMMTNRKGLGENIVIIWPGNTTIPYQGLPKGRGIHFYPEDLEYLRATVPGIKDIGAEYQRWSVELVNGTTVKSELIAGITPNFTTMRNHIAQMGGRMINQSDCDNKRRTAFLGYRIAEDLFPGENPIGKQFLLQGLPFTVVGIEIEKQQMNMYSGPDADKVSIPWTTFKAIFGDPWLDDIIYQPVDPANVKEVQRQVYEVLGAKYRFDPNDEETLGVWDTVSGTKEFDNIMLGIQVFLGIIGGLTLLIAGVGVANIMYVSIRERTREIGIKMAVGARRSVILFQFLIEALMITFLGGIGGMSISYILTEGFKRVPIESDVLTFMGRPTISLEIGIIVTVILGVMGILAGFFPALRAASVSPVESLRYE